jgi:archaemetzincin
MRRPPVLAIAAALGLAALAAAPAAARAGDAASAAQATRPTVCVVPLGRYEKRLVPIVVRGIEYLYRLPVRVIQGRALPRSAWYGARKRYRAEKLLEYLDAEVLPGSGCDLLMGFTRSDISTTKGSIPDWGILGLAWIGGPSGVVSTYRLGRRVDDRAKAMRAVKVVNHELGHALGLDHHDLVGCLMEDAGGTVRTVDRESGLLCDESRHAIEELRSIHLPDHASFDWSRVLPQARAR